ncbi:MAG TPA: hypothetical protein VM261_27230 [Kofleriaceae bacterium]|nr:hypothetical protein [Kofleriaceae bacterium]
MKTSLSSLALLTTALSASLFTAACGFAPDGGGEGLATQLRQRAFLDITKDSDVAVSATGRGGQSLAVNPSVLGGEAILRTTQDGWLLVEDLEIPLDDVTVPPGMLSDRPVTFTDIALRLGTQLAVSPLAPIDDADVSLVGWGDADLLLDWSMLSWDGQDHLPLAMRRIADVPFAVAVEMDADGELHASITARVDGVVDDLGELVVLEDLAVDVVSTTAAPVIVD